MQNHQLPLLPLPEFRPAVAGKKMQGVETHMRFHLMTYLLIALLSPFTLGAVEDATNDRIQLAAGDPLAAVVALADKSRATLADAVPYIAQLAGQDAAGQAGAAKYLVDRGILAADAADAAALDRPLRRGMLARLIMQARGWGGGIMYSIFGGGRYAWRELVYRRVMPAGGSEYSPVSGGELLAVIGRAAGEVDLKME